MERTRLTELCQQLQRTYAERLSRQHVRLSCDVDPRLVCELPQPLVRRMLDSWIDEALEKMPGGGELDLTFVVSQQGLEIEVADSRETDLHETQSYWYRCAQVRNGSIIQTVAGTEVRVEAALCPQGGLARTLTLVHRPAADIAPTQAWRKVA
jgi:hypothetical protein